MKLSPGAVARIQCKWSGVERMLDNVRAIVGTANSSWFGPGPMRKAIYNLPLLLAFDVLARALKCARDEKLFEAETGRMGKLMDDARDALNSKNWQNLRDGVRRRNQVAHEGQLFDSEQCMRDINNVEAQLRAWGILKRSASG
jgi:hypothetical protein